MIYYSEDTGLMYVEEEVKLENHSTLYLVAVHTELYEKYGYAYLKMHKDHWNYEARIYYKNEIICIGKGAE